MERKIKTCSDCKHQNVAVVSDGKDTRKYFCMKVRGKLNEDFTSSWEMYDDNLQLKKRNKPCTFFEE